MDFRTGRRGLILVYSSFALLALSGCGGGGSSNDGGGDDAAKATESSYCTSRPTYSGGVSVTGTATYEYRPVSVVGGLDGDPVTANIPYAEIVVTNSAGTVVQCGETSATGAISLTVPAGAANYAISIRSRSSTDKVKVSVIEDYYANQPYAITKTFGVGASDTAVNIGNINASARASVSSKIEGGAFNILAQIYKANEYIRTESGNAAFVAPKVSAYWKAGYNPYNYFGGSSLLSFYRPGTYELFILGGNSGDVKSADTDHFDNSVILHEYAHFLEDIYATSESPGGAHDGDGMIDARLAWSEGWANFFQAAVLQSGDSGWKYYIDTVGFTGDSVEGGNGGLAIKVELTIAGSDGRCYTGSSSYCDKVGVSGEGTFREMSISRSLFKTIRSTGNGGAGVSFGKVWDAFSGTETGGVSVGLGSRWVAFRNIGLFYGFLANLVPSGSLTAWSNVLSDEKQTAGAANYGTPVTRVAQGTCSNLPKSMNPSVDFTGGSSNPLTSNDFYWFTYDGSSTQSLKLIYSNGSNNRDLNVYVYKQDYVYQESGAASTGGIIRSSAALWATEQGTETVSLTGLPAGHYLINVKADTYGKSALQLTGTMTYNLRLTTGSTTEDLCPTL